MPGQKPPNPLDDERRRGHEIDKLTWMNVGGDNWVFGECMRGMVRNPVAEVYFTIGLCNDVEELKESIRGMSRAGDQGNHGRSFTEEEIKTHRDYGWVWMVWTKPRMTRGVAANLHTAAARCEEAYLKNGPPEAQNG